MREIYKNPIFYYVLAPVIAALWPAVMWGVYLPGVRAGLDEDMAQYDKAMKLFEELKQVDPERLDYAKEKGASADFDYATAVQQTAEFCSVPAGSYRLSSGMMTVSEGQKSQFANVYLKDVDITRAARFLSTIQIRWSGLQCTKITLKKKKGLPDSWDADFTFKYFY
jgi:hypothetical protein